MCVQWFAQSFGLVILFLSVKQSRADEVSGESLQNITAFSLSFFALTLLFLQGYFGLSCLC